MDCLVALFTHLARQYGLQPQDIAIYQEVATRKKVFFGGDDDGRRLAIRRELVTSIRGWTFKPTDSYENSDLLVVDSTGAHGYANAWQKVPDGIVISYSARVDKLLEELRMPRPGWDVSISTTLFSEVAGLLNMK